MKWKVVSTLLPLSPVQTRIRPHLHERAPTTVEPRCVYARTYNTRNIHTHTNTHTYICTNTHTRMHRQLQPYREEGCARENGGYRSHGGASAERRGGSWRRPSAGAFHCTFAILTSETRASRFPIFLSYFTCIIREYPRVHKAVLYLVYEARMIFVEALEVAA